MTGPAFKSRHKLRALLEAAPEKRVLTVARVALSQAAAGECPAYLTALNRAIETEPPPFSTEEYVEIYREASAHRQWMAISLMSNAEREGDGATRLWSLSACCSDPEEANLLKQHAVDESRHALVYLKLLDLTFPGEVEPTFRKELRQLSPGYTMSRDVFAVEGSPYARTPSVDDFVQMNIAEIRTTLHHLMQRSALAKHCPVASLPTATKILDALLRDELHHVAYTGVLIDKKQEAAHADELSALFCQRMRDFNEITRRELQQRVFD